MARANRTMGQVDVGTTEIVVRIKYQRERTDGTSQEVTVNTIRSALKHWCGTSFKLVDVSEVDDRKKEGAV